MRSTAFHIAILTFISACASSSRAAHRDAVVGSYVWGDEVNEFRPCGSDSVFWVLAKPELITRLRLAHDSMTTRPYEKIYVSIQGHRSSKPADGFAEQTNGYFEITAILEMRPLRKGECGVAA